MKIGIYHHTFIYGSGIDNVIKEIANRLSKNHKVEINTFFDNRKDCKAKINRFSKSRKKSVFTSYNPIVALRTIRSVKKYDIVMTHIYPMNLLVSLGSLIYKKPHVAYFWGAPPSWMVKGITEKLYHKYLRFTEKIIPKIGVTKSLVPNEFIKKWNKNKNAEILPMHGVDLKRFSMQNINKNNCKKIRKKLKIPANAKIIFTLGRVTPYKGIDLLIKVLEIVRQKHHDTYLIVGGSFWNEKYLNYLKSISDKYTILAGLVPEKDLVDYYGMCDIYLSASKWEGQLCAEALAMEKPYIAFDTTSHKYTIQNGKNGFLVRPYSVAKFAEKIIYLFDNPLVMRSLGKKGYKWAHENTSYDVITKKLEKILSSHIRT